MTGAPKLTMVTHVTLTTPIWGSLLSND